ncbi:MAG: D-alanyl-D-alanine carboxypeptidase [Alphaproteobacteria bacterium]|nr:D-alanyl-D-alanine carboxypeptidase [Alphaproteobacteria bacterium]
MNKFCLFILLLISYPALADSRRSSILIEPETGIVLSAENPSEKRYPASLTKMMTIYLVFDALEKNKISMSDELTVSAKAAKMPKSRIGLKAGETISVENAILALISRSANDASVVLAEALAGSEFEFAKKMTETANQLGMTSTVFRNASGLHNPEQVTTAQDMATLSKALIKHFPEYYKLFSVKGFRFKKKYIGNHNLVARYYRGGDGLKTGYVDASGYHVVGSAVQNGKRLIGVIMGRNSVRERDRHIFKLLDYGFNELNKNPILLTSNASLTGNNQAIFGNQNDNEVNETIFRKNKIQTERLRELTELLSPLKEALLTKAPSKITEKAIVEWKK